MSLWSVGADVSRRRRYDALVRKCHAPALRHAERSFDSLGSAEKVVADAFEKAWWVLRDGGTVNLGWLLGFVDNTKRDRDRSECALDAATPLLLAETLRAAVAPDVHLRIELERIFAHLTAGDRYLIELLDMDGYAAAEVAGLLGLSQAAVRKRHQRARESLRALLEAAEVGIEVGGGHVG